MNRRRLISIVVAVALLVGIGVLLAFNNNEDKPAPIPADNGGATTSGAVETFIPLDEMDLPDIVAVINGQEIKREQLLKDYNQMKVLYESVDIDTSLPETQAFMKEALISDLISTTLLAQEADRVGIQVDDTRLAAALETVIAGFASRDDYIEMLNKLDTTEAEFKEKLRRQLRISDLMKKQFDEVVDSSDGLKFTEEEKRNMYAIIDAQLGGLPSYEEVEETVDQMLEYNKAQVIIGDFIQTLIKESKIEVRI
jgi:peptidyl-prolyl cis-trans isomerase SurA